MQPTDTTFHRFWIPAWSITNRHQCLSTQSFLPTGHTYNIYKSISMHSIALRLPAQLQGTFHLPASKSISARALVLAALSGTPQPGNLSDCDDTRVLRKALKTVSGEVDIHAAGTAMRFSTACLATTPGVDCLITGTQRMQQRPIAILVDALQSLGADIRYAGAIGFPPLHVRGKTLDGGKVSLPADISSQYISALLMISPTLRGGLVLQLQGEIASRPYIDMTLSLMREFGANACWTDAQTLRVEEGNYHALPSFTVEPDWSAASYAYELVALSPDSNARLTLPGLHFPSLQGDSIVAELFRNLGVHTLYDSKGVVLQKADLPHHEPVWEVDFSQFPDLAQTLVVTCVMLDKPFRFTGLQSLRIKETDRVEALACEFQKLGFPLTTEPSAISYEPKGKPSSRPSSPPSISTYEDHRMAMSFAPAAWQFPHLKIEHPEVVTKSFPSFWRELQGLGASSINP